MNVKQNRLISTIRVIFALNLLASFLPSQLFGQNADSIIYYKPNGTLAQRAMIVEEMSQDEINSMTQEFINAYPYFTVIAPASSRYNCFGYAFCITEKSDTINLGYHGYANVVNVFTKDGDTVSFKGVEENQNPDKAILIENECKYPGSSTYSPHAAIVYDNNTLISKLGDRPVFKHPKHAYIQGSIELDTTNCYKYYKRNYTINLSGPDLVNEPATFTAAFTNANFNQITWEVEPAGLFQSSTGNGLTANLQIRANPTHLADSGRITFYLGHTNGDNRYRVTKRFAIQIPTCTVTSNAAYSEGFTIKPGATVTVTGKINNKANSIIRVPPSGKLYLNGGILTNTVVNQMWKGIVVLGNSGLSQTEQNQGTVELSGALIEHAVCAIAAHIGGFNIPVDSLSGGIIKAVNSTFKNNLQAIAYAPYENKIQSVSLWTMSENSPNAPLPLITIIVFPPAEYFSNRIFVCGACEG